MHDLVIIGGAAAGSAAAVYAARRKLDFIMVSEDFGGEVANSGEVWNYPGFAETTGMELVDAFKGHLEANDVKPELGVRINTIEQREDKTFSLAGTKGSDEVQYETKAVIVATGVHPRHLGIPGEEAYRGKGVSYCSTCDGPLFRNKKVVTIGGGNSALESSLMLAEIADHVTVINIHDAFKGEQVLIDKVMNNEKITTIFQAETAKIEGEMLVKSLTYKDVPSGEEKTIETDGVFVHIGWVPNSDLVPEGVKRNKWGEIEINLKAETSMEGLYAAGDVTNIPFKQIAIATGQGVTAALSAIEYLNKQR